MISVAFSKISTQKNEAVWSAWEQIAPQSLSDEAREHIYHGWTEGTLSLIIANYDWDIIRAKFHA